MLYGDDDDSGGVPYSSIGGLNEQMRELREVRTDSLASHKPWAQLASTVQLFSIVQSDSSC